MKSCVWRVIFGVSLLVSAGVLSGQDATSRSGPSGGRESSAIALVQQALQAEAENNPARRNAMLEEALHMDPECAPARWHSGFIRLDDRWLTLAEVQSQFAADPQLAEYRQVRESLAESPLRELLLARWCAEKKLTDEARFHWLNVLRMEPLNQEALRALDVQWYNGLLLTRDQVAVQKRKDFQASRDTMNLRSAHIRRWESRVANWEVAAGRDDSNLLATMEADLAAETSRNAIVMVNAVMGRRSEDPRDPAAFQVVSRNWLAILAKDPANTKYLVLYAIGHPMEPVRIAAAEELKKRPREEYVPLLLACARFPVEFACSLLAFGGIGRAQYTFDIQGLEADRQIDHADCLNIPADFYAPEMLHSHLRIRSNDYPERNDDMSLPRPARPARAIYPLLFTATAVGRAQDMRSFVDQYNAASVEINQRVTEALTRATGEDLESNPRVWQSWWKQYLCDYYELDPLQTGGGQSADRQQGVGTQGSGSQSIGGQQQERPVYQYSSSSQQYVPPPPPPPPSMTVYMSCFRGSTPVWTMTGPRAIEEIRPGDRVLSQNISSGELAYKVVQEVTKRNPSPMIKITVGDEAILATLGHPFWVNGKRWIMAKHLQADCVLHTISGPRTIDTVEEIPAAVEWYEFSYNLQVADYHTFFVGENQILVHHLSMLSILDEGSSQVPGL
ncbi:MAG: polymorphic toxin-type HINT domain-containing protein [Pirellulaceae bacterium]